MNQEQKMYRQEIGCGCSVNVSVCVQGVCKVGVYEGKKRGPFCSSVEFQVYFPASTAMSSFATTYPSESFRIPAP